MNKRLKRQLELVEQLDKEQKYDQYVIDESMAKYESVTGDYQYLNHGFWISLIGLIIRFLIVIFIPIYLKIAYGLRFKNRENYKKVKKQSFIGVCNHSQVLDCGISRVAFLSKRYYCVSATINNKQGVSGKILASIGNMPIAVTLSGKRNFSTALETVLKNKKTAVMFYPERGMWPYYKRPRPFNRGAFYYAVKNNVPILPMFEGYRKPNKLEKFLHIGNRKITVKYLEPVYAKKNLDEKENIEYMQNKCQWLINQEYKKFYGKDDVIVQVNNPDENI